MKVALNLEASGWLGGRYYLRNLALALREHAPDVDLIAIGLSDPEFAELLPIVADLPEDADVVFPNWARSGPVRTAELHWIPDLQHRVLPENFGRFERLRRDRGYRRLARRARLVVVSSEVVREEAARAYPDVAEKLRVLHFASVAEPGRKDPAEVTARLALPDRYVLLPNQFWAHKNHTTAFAAAGELPLPLVCTGEAADHRRPEHVGRLLANLERSGDPTRVHLAGVVARGDYLALVRGAAAVLQPSLFEGWSTVVEDARAYGRPLALSDIPVHREQDPPLAAFFAPLDPQSLAAAVRTAVAYDPLPEEVAATAQRARAAAYATRFVELAREAAAS